MRKAIGPMIRWLPLAVALALAGCAQETVPQDQFYRLRVAVPTQAFGAPPLQGTLEVERLDADGLIASRPIVYSNAKTPNRVDEYHYHFWTESPPVLVQDALVAYLRGAGAAKVVVTPEVRVEPDYELSGRLSRFEQVRGAGAKVGGRGRVRLRERNDDRLLLLKTYRVETPTDSETVSDAVAAFDTALEQVLAALTRDIGEAR